jgi:hypothetical protein
MRDDLHRLAQIIAAALLGDDLLVDPAGGPVVIAAELGVGEALIMAKVEVGLRAVVGHKDFAMLERRHRARIHVQVWVKLHQLTLSPRLSSRQPIEAAASPLPKDETTPPVTKMYLADMTDKYEKDREAGRLEEQKASSRPSGS